MTYAYPKWKHHASLPSRMVKDPDEEAALGPEWTDRRQQPMHAGPVTRCPHCERVEKQIFEMKQKFDASWAETIKDQDYLNSEIARLTADSAALQKQLAAASKPPRNKPPKAATP